MNQPHPGRVELAELEAAVVDALKNRDDSTLNILGFGEVSVALGWPTDNPKFVCKRTTPFTKAQFTAYEQLVIEYISSLRDVGLDVVDTTIVPLDRGDSVIAYIVQPMLDSATLGYNVLRANEPDADLPFLAALAETLDIVTPNLSIDAQASNFAWDGSTLTLVDIGTPFMWDAAGQRRFDLAPFSKMLPAPTRRLAMRELTELMSRWKEPRRVAIDVIANLYREGLPEWVDPAVQAMNRKLDAADAITATEARKFYEEDAKTWPALKKAQAVERWWQTSIRRRPYDWFIYSSFES